MVICIGVAVAHMTRPGGLVQPPGNECKERKKERRVKLGHCASLLAPSSTTD